MGTVEVDILREFLAAEGKPVSGGRLAAKLGISRVAVWSRMERLRKAGFAFQARTKTGYRLTGVPDTLSLWYLQAAFPPGGPVFHFHDELDSTNSEAERLLAAGQPVPFLVLAGRQTSGRGRRGRSWFSRDQGNLYLSCAFRPSLPPARMRTFTLWMGVSLCHCLEQATGAPVQIKWPNDLFLHGRKLGGILTEARIDSEHMHELVFGLGLNINGNPAAWPGEIRDVAISLRQFQRGISLCLNRMTADLVRQILEAYNTFMAENHEPALRRLWPSHDMLAGREVTACDGRQILHGRAEGIDGEGRLLLRAEGGALLRLSAGDVTLQGEWEK